MSARNLSSSVTKGQSSKVTYLLLFLGGSIGVVARYLVEFSLNNSEDPALLATSVVNLAGALLLGFVNTHRWFDHSYRKLFFGHSLLGGFTTMSGLAAVAVASGLGASFGALGYWLFIFAQLIAGVLFYSLGLQIAKQVNK
jgi:fluoride exporter